MLKLHFAIAEQVTRIIIQVFSDTPRQIPDIPRGKSLIYQQIVLNLVITQTLFLECSSPYASS